MAIQPRAEGYVTIWKNGVLVSEGSNTITTLGRNWIADITRGRDDVSGLTTAKAYCAVGYSGNTTVAASSGLTLEAPTGSIGRTLIGSLYRDTTGSTLYVTTPFYTSGGLGPLQEIGLFTTGYAIDESTVLVASVDTASGCMISRYKHGIVTNTATDVIIWY